MYKHTTVIPAKDYVAQLDEIEKDALLILLLTARPNRMDEYFVFQGRKWIITPKGVLPFDGYANREKST